MGLRTGFSSYRPHDLQPVSMPPFSFPFYKIELIIISSQVNAHKAASSVWNKPLLSSYVMRSKNGGCLNLPPNSASCLQAPKLGRCEYSSVQVIWKPVLQRNTPACTHHTDPKLCEVLCRMPGSVGAFDGPLVSLNPPYTN